MNSFDVFDTLIARRYINNERILRNMGYVFDVSNFYERRTLADNGQRNLYQIYEALVEGGFVPADKSDAMLHYEIEQEIENAIPIQKNIDRVQDGDVLVSDMYLPAYAIMAMVRACGMNKQVTLYQSNGGKASGHVWANFKPKLHLGDNKHSDVEMPKRFGVRAEYYQPDLEPCSTHLELLKREIKLADANEDNLTDVAREHNLTFLFATCEYLHRTYKDVDFVFLGRDCFLMHKIYTAYYGTATYLPFSRKVAKDNPELATHYLKSQSPKDAMFIDISSTGATWEKINDVPITVAFYSDIYHYTPEKPTLSPRFNYIMKSSEFGQTNLILEMFNCADHGQLSEIKLHGDTVLSTCFEKPELPTEYIQFFHKPIYKAAELAKIYRWNIRGEFASYSIDKLKEMIAFSAMAICSREDLMHIAQYMESKS